jgi:hypothetical protein
MICLINITETCPGTVAPAQPVVYGDDYTSEFCFFKENYLSSKKSAKWRLAHQRLPAIDKRDLLTRYDFSLGIYHITYISF